MTNRDKAQWLRDLEFHLGQYRSARREVALQAMRLEIVTDAWKQKVGFHALGVAEALDRLNGSTR